MAVVENPASAAIDTPAATAASAIFADISQTPCVWKRYLLSNHVLRRGTSAFGWCDFWRPGLFHQFDRNVGAAGLHDLDPLGQRCQEGAEVPAAVVVLIERGIERQHLALEAAGGHLVRARLLERADQER